MAGRDYIRCKTCHARILYDGYDDGRERLEVVWGDPKAKEWTVGLLCPDCIKKLENPWVKLEDRVPEQGEKVLWYDAMFDKVHAFALDYPEMPGDYTHWMPLTKPWEFPNE